MNNNQSSWQHFFLSLRNTNWSNETDPQYSRISSAMIHSSLTNATNLDMVVAVSDNNKSTRRPFAQNATELLHRNCNTNKIGKAVPRTPNQRKKTIFERKLAEDAELRNADCTSRRLIRLEIVMMNVCAFFHPRFLCATNARVDVWSSGQRILVR